MNPNSLKYRLLELSGVYHIAANTRLFSHVLIGLIRTHGNHLSLSALDGLLVAKSLLDTGIAILLGTTGHQSTVLEDLLGCLTTFSLLQLLSINFHTPPHSLLLT